MAYDGLPTIDDQVLAGKRVLLRVAYDVPLTTTNGKTVVADDTRLRVTVPTIQQLLANGCAVVICGGWLGRPKGQVVSELRMDPVAERLNQLLNLPVHKLDDCVGDSVTQAVSQLAPGQIVLLENTRFHPEESANDPQFADQLAALGEVCVFDAFAQAHRNHASTVGLVERLPTVLGPLMVAELTALNRVTTSPEPPFVVVMGGAKITDKMQLLRKLIDAANQVLIGGAIANVFIRARGGDVGASMVESAPIDGQALDPLVLARELSERAGDKLILPTDFMAGDDQLHPTITEVVVLGPDSAPTGHGFFDIGPATQARFAEIIRTAKTVFWNGTMGVNTTSEYAAGSKAVATAIAHNKQATTIVGGGDTSEAVHQFGLDNEFTHVSTGGGASLAVVSGTGLAVLDAMHAKGGSRAAV